MHAFFNLKHNTLQGIQKFPEWHYVRDGLKRNLGMALRYYRKSPLAVNSAHFLVRLLQSIAVSQNQNLQRYYDNVDAVALDVSMALKMTSSIYKGQIFEGVFYGPDSREILIAHTEPFDIYRAHRDWMNMCPVKVLRHARSDLGLHLPDGTEAGIESGLAVIAINIPLLAIQYRAFSQNELLAMDDAGDQRSVMQFVHMYVLPNMLPSHLDLALFNRIDCIRKGAPLGVPRKKLPVQLLDYHADVDEVYYKALDLLQDADKDFANILRMIPAAYFEDMAEVMRLPDMAPTRQVDWALTVSRLNVWLFIFQASKSGASARNRYIVNRLLREIMAYKSNNIMRSMLPVDLYLEIEAEIQGIIDGA